MSLSQDERAEIRAEVYNDLCDIEDQISHRAGSYNFLCLLDGEPTFTHYPVGRVLRAIVHNGAVVHNGVV
jgi:hypothetical protein